MFMEILAPFSTSAFKENVSKDHVTSGYFFSIKGPPPSAGALLHILKPLRIPLRIFQDLQIRERSFGVVWTLTSAF
jgi:hypothetical protein